KMDKTAVVSVERLYIHSLYGKAIKSMKKYSAHDENNKCQIGDKVIIASIKPISKTKKPPAEAFF
ncbi:MAG: 30S ribosomal protein S17, partial [candidate division Zixibacteria bacterium]|nr:30S ribosomal protein S17 [candidate division Zixibacteria bacterium]